MDEHPYIPDDRLAAGREFLKFMDTLARDAIHGTHEAARQVERKIIKLALPPVDLREIPREQWDNYIDRDVTMPPSVQTVPSTPLTEAQVHAIEEGTEKFHAVTQPYYIHMSFTLQQTGRPWLFEPEVGKFLTGLTLGKEISNKQSAISNA